MSELGLLLVVLGAALVVVEAHVPSHGVIGSGAVVAIAAGLALALAGTGVAAALAVAIGLLAALAGGTYLAFTLRKVMIARHRAIRSGGEGLIGRIGVLRAKPAPLGQVFVDGALWRCRLWVDEAEDAQLTEGSAVVVEAIDGLTLTVRPAEEWEVV
jgi:membrane-bound ClpP family serine protease